MTTRKGTRWRPRRHGLKAEPLEARYLLASDLAFQNQYQPLDVNYDLRVSPLDALNVINRIARTGPDATLPSSNDLGQFFDVNGSNTATPIDALIIINALGRQSPLISGRLSVDSAPNGEQNFDRLSNSFALEFGLTNGNQSDSLEIRIDGTSSDSFVPVTEPLIDDKLTLSESRLEELAGAVLDDGMHHIEIRVAGHSVVESFEIQIDRKSPVGQILVSPTINEAPEFLDLEFDEAVVVDFDFDQDFDLERTSGPNSGSKVDIVSATPYLSRFVRLGLAEKLDDQSFAFDVLAAIDDFAGNSTTLSPASFSVADPTGIAELSPRPGEAHVTVLRDVVVRFDERVEPASVTGAGQSAIVPSVPAGQAPGSGPAIHVVAGGERLAGRLVVSSTDQFATYYFDDPLPASTEVRIIVEGDRIMGQDGLAIDADGDNQPGGSGGGDFRTLSLTPIAGTGVYGFVKDSSTGEPVVGATIRVDSFPELNVVTDGDGRFELMDTPAPAFFVHIDGTTATNLPEGYLYPNVGKPFHSSPGKVVQLNHHGDLFDIYLPRLKESDITPLSPTAVTPVGFGDFTATTVQKSVIPLPSRRSHPIELVASEVTEQQIDALQDDDPNTTHAKIRTGSVNVVATADGDVIAEQTFLYGSIIAADGQLAFAPALEEQTSDQAEEETKTIVLEVTGPVDQLAFSGDDQDITFAETTPGATFAVRALELVDPLQSPSGELRLSNDDGQLPAVGVNAADAPSVQDTPDDSFIRLELKPDGSLGLDAVGRIAIANAALGNYITIRDAFLSIDTVNDNYLGFARVETPIKRAGEITALVGFEGGELDIIALGIGQLDSGIGFQIGTTPLFLQSIGGGLKDLSQGLRGVDLIAAISATLGPGDPQLFPAFTLPSWLGGLSFPGADLLRIDVGGNIGLDEMNLGGQVVVGGDSGGGLIEGVGKIEANFNDPALKISARLEALDGLLSVGGIGGEEFATMTANSNFDIAFQGQSTARLPDDLPYGLGWAEGRTLSSSSAKFEFSNDGNSANNFLAFWGSVDLFTNPFTGNVVTATAGLQIFLYLKLPNLITSLEEAESIASIGGEGEFSGQTNFVIPAGQPYAIFSAEWETASAAVQLSLSDPDGNVLTLDDIDSDPDAFLINRSDTGFNLVINEPLQGTWTGIVSDPALDDLGQLQFSALLESPVPTVDVNGLSFNESELLTVSLDTTNTSAAASASVFLDDDRSDFDGVLLAANVPIDSGAASIPIDLSQTEYRDGEYFVYVRLDDPGKPPAQSDYMPIGFQIENSMAPAANENVSAKWLGSDQLQVQWDSNAAAESYIIRLTSDAAGQGFQQTAIVNDPAATSVVLSEANLQTALIPGETYRLAVIAIDEDGVAGDDSGQTVAIVGASASLAPFAQRSRSRFRLTARVIFAAEFGDPLFTDVRPDRQWIRDESTGD